MLKIQDRSATPAGSPPVLAGSRSNTKKGGIASSPRINYLCIAMYKHLTCEQRYAIYLGKQEGRSQTAIARQIGVDKSTVSRELKRNSNRFGKYG